MSYSTILFDVDDGIATITLNRPDRLNAWTGPMGAELRAAMETADADPEVRVIILTGAGRGFCAGADMGYLATVTETGETGGGAGPKPYDPDARADFHHPMAYFPTVKTPIIAAVNGPAAGMGFVISLYCDLRFAADSAAFVTAFAKRGLIAEHGISWTLPRLVGHSRAMDLLLSSRKVGADEAYRIGLVDRVFPTNELMAETRAYARELVEMVSPRSMKVIKRQLWESMFQDLGEALEVADREMAASLKTEDFKEGVAHFVEKRPPRFPAA